MQNRWNDAEVFNLPCRISLPICLTGFTCQPKGTAFWQPRFGNTWRIKCLRCPSCFPTGGRWTTCTLRPVCCEDVAQERAEGAQPAPQSSSADGQPVPAACCKCQDKDEPRGWFGCMHPVLRAWEVLVINAVKELEENCSELPCNRRKEGGCPKDCLPQLQGDPCGLSHLGADM